MSHSELTQVRGGGVIALESFQRDFGIDQSKGPTFVANIQGNIVAILQGGAFFGAIFGGQLENKLGRKWSLMVGSWIFVVGAIVQVVATTGVSSVYGGRFTAGFGVGLMSVGESFAEPLFRIVVDQLFP